MCRAQYLLRTWHCAVEITQEKGHNTAHRLRAKESTKRGYASKDEISSWVLCVKDDWRDMDRHCDSGSKQAWRRRDQREIFQTVKFTIFFHIANAFVVQTVITNIQTITCPRQKKARPGVPLFNHYTTCLQENELRPFGGSLDVFQRKRSVLS